LCGICGGLTVSIPGVKMRHFFPVFLKCDQLAGMRDERLNVSLPKTESL
jgi:hypothetical protein